jgi:hypothetical protein
MQGRAYGNGGSKRGSRRVERERVGTGSCLEIRWRPAGMWRGSGRLRDDYCAIMIVYPSPAHKNKQSRASSSSESSTAISLLPFAGGSTWDSKRKKGGERGERGERGYRESGGFAGGRQKWHDLSACRRDSGTRLTKRVRHWSELLKQPKNAELRQEVIIS